MNQTQQNRLINESSPYLQQHADNPVDWYPWGEEAILKAQEENKPILLSIGYAACHWCHVMAHESFADGQTAKLMNDLFINIKVDREERPDLDKIYQTAHYILSQQSGGWPLTIFLTPDLIPFYSGTYFPKESRYHLPAFQQVLLAIADAYKQQLDAIKKQNSELVKLLQKTFPEAKEIQLNEKPLEIGSTALIRIFDYEHGGFDGAPKFPQAPKLRFLINVRSDLVIFTLQQMLYGGIYDQLTGGFYRYTVDDAWQIPHFEKMLYDNAQLLFLLCEAYKHTSQDVFKHSIIETIAFLQNLKDESHAYYSSLDADSEGEEGKFYLWNLNEFKEILSPQEFMLAKSYYGLDKPPNMEHAWHLTAHKTIDEVASELSIDVDQAKSLLNSSKNKLLAAREKRVHPFVDNKILTSWNALLVKALFYAGDILEIKNYIDMAEQTLNFLTTTMWNRGKLYSLYAQGKIKNPGFIDDYVFLLDALLTSLQTRWDTKHLDLAKELIEGLATHFVDEKGGFYFTSDEQNIVLYRPKVFMDEAIPSANGIAAQCLIVFGYLLGNEKYLSMGEKILQAAWASLLNYPAEHCSLLLGLKEYLHPSKIIILRGEEPYLSDWYHVCKNTKHKVFAIPKDISDLPDAIALRKPRGNICAYICEANVCSDVIEDLGEFKKLMNSA